MTVKINYWFDTGNTRLKMRSEIPTTVDVVVIGGGIAGMSTLYWLLKYDINAILVDQADIGFRATGRSNGVIGCPPLCDINEDEYDFIRQNNRLIYNIIKDEYIDCDFSFGGELQLSDESWSDVSFDNVLHIDNKALNMLLPAHQTKNAIYTPVTNTVNMYQLLYGLGMMCELSGNRLFGNIDVMRLEESKTGVLVHTVDGNTIACKHVVACSNNLACIGKPDILKKVSVTAMCTKIFKENINQYPFLSVHTIRDQEGRVDRLSHYNNRTFIDAYNCDITDKFNKANFEYSWQGHIYETPDKRPLIGRFRGHPRISVNTGHGYYGLSYVMLGGKVIADLIKRKKNSITEKQKKLFSPNRYASKKGAI
jgi:glycine/D-amino acid oxidase-like deaminating enzyme